ASMEDTRASRAEGSTVMARAKTFAGCLDSDQSHFLVIEKSAEDPHRVGTAPHAGHYRVRQGLKTSEHLFPRLPPDHGLEVADHPGERIGAHHRPDDVMRGRHVGDPVAQSFV